MDSCKIHINGEETNSDFERAHIEATEKYKTIADAIEIELKEPKMVLDAIFNAFNSGRGIEGFIKLRKEQINLAKTPEEKEQAIKEQAELEEALSLLKTYSKDHFNSLSSQTIAVVNFLQNSLTVTEYLRKQFQKIIKDDTIDIYDKKNYIQGIKHYTDIIEQVNDQLSEELGIHLSVDDFFTVQSGRISQNIKKINTIYKTNIVDIVADWLYTAIPEENKELSEVNVKKLKHHEERLADATAKGDAKRIKNITKSIESVKKEQISKEYIKELLSNSKDSNYLSYMFEAAGKSGDPIISSFTKKLKEQRIKARSKFHSTKIIKLQEAFDKYKNATNGSTTNLQKFNDQLYDMVDVIEIKKGPVEGLIKAKYEILESVGENLHLVKSKQQQLNRWYSVDFDNDLARLNFNIKKEVEKIVSDTDDRTALEEAKDAKRKWLIQNSQSYYVNEYYELDSVLSTESKVKLNNASEKVKEMEIHFHADPSVENFTLLIEAEKTKSLLKFEKDNDGNYTKSALEITKYYELMSNRYEDIDFTTEELAEAEKKYENHKNAKINQLNGMVFRGEITAQEQQVILRRFEINARYTGIKPEFYAEKKSLQEGIDEIREALNQRLEVLNVPLSKSSKEKISLLYEELAQIKGTKKDADNMVMGDIYSSEDQVKIRDIQQQINDLRQYILITEEEKRELASLSKTSTKTAAEKARFKELDLKNKKDYKLKRDPIIKVLLSEMKVQQNKLSAMSERFVTDYYTSQYNELYDKLLNDVKSKDPSLSDVKAGAKARELITTTEWFKNNHFQVAIFDKNTKKHTIDYKPTSIWTVEVPKDDDYKISRLKSRYLKPKVKKEFINTNRDPHAFYDGHRDLGYVPSRGSKYDKTSSSFGYSSTSKAWPKSKEVLEVIDSLTEYWAEEQKSLPSTYQSGYSLPIVEKDKITDKIVEGEGKISWFVRGITKTENDINEGVGTLHAEIEDSLESKGSLKIYDQIPVRYTNRMASENVSYDIFGNLAKFTHENLLREQMNVMMPDAKMLLDSLDTKDKQDIKKQSGFFKLRPAFSLKSGDSVRKEHVKNIILANMFGEYEQEQSFIGNISLNKTVSQLNRITALTTLGWKMPGAVVNFISAEVQKLIESVAGKHVTPADLAKGHALFAKNASGFIQDGFRYREEKSPFTSMVIAWNVLQGDYDGQVGSEFRKTFSKSIVETNLFSMNLRQFGESDTQITLWLAIMSKHNVILKNTKTNTEEEMNLFDAYMKLYEEEGDDGNKKRTLSLHEYEGNYEIYKTKYNETVGKFEKDNLFTFNDEVNIQLLVEDINIELNGNYDKFNRPTYEKWAVGKAASLFRRFFVPMAVRRWGGANEKRYNINKSDWEEGFYIATFKFFKEWIRKDGQTSSELLKDPRVRQALARSAAEAVFLLTLYITIFAIMGDDDDGDDDNGNDGNGKGFDINNNSKLKYMSFWLLHLLYILKKVLAETETFNVIGGYNEIRRIIDDPFVFLYQIDKTAAGLMSLKDLIMGSENAYYKRDTPGIFKKGDSKTLAKVMKVLGLRLDTFYPEQMLKNFNYGQRNR